MLKFKTSNGTVLEVVEEESYSWQRVLKGYREYLKSLRPSVLVSVAFYGRPTPLITIEGGVIRLIKIRIEDEVYKGSAAISRKLGIAGTKNPRILTPA